MATGIEWCDEVWNPVTGCSPVSEGCEHCYAARMAKRLAGRCGYYKEDPFRVTWHADRLDAPRSWRKQRRVFVCSMGDLFHEDVPFEWINVIVTRASVIDQYKPAHERHAWIFLTKRPERVLSWRHWVLNETAFVEHLQWFQRFAWVGVSFENQAQAEKRLPVLMRIGARRLFVSVEPMLGPVDLERVRFPHGGVENVLTDKVSARAKRNGIDKMNSIDWVVCGGETGPGARPMHPQWVEDLMRQCHRNAVSFFFKSWGEWALKGTVDGTGAKFGVLTMDGEFFAETTGWNGRSLDPDTNEAAMLRVGKKKAGHLIEGREERMFPHAMILEGDEIPF